MKSRKCKKCGKVKKHYSGGKCRSCYVKKKQYSSSLGGRKFTFYMPEGKRDEAKEYFRSRLEFMMEDVKRNPRKRLDDVPGVVGCEEFSVREQRIVNFFCTFHEMVVSERKKFACRVFNKGYSWNEAYFELVNRTVLSLRILERMGGNGKI